MFKDVNEKLLDHSHLKPGQNASLLSYDKTIHMYRENVKKTNDLNIQCDFAIFLVEAAKRSNRSSISRNDDKRVTIHKYIVEAEKLLKQVAMRGHSEGQYYLANMYAAGLLKINNNNQHVGDFDKAFPLFVQSAKKHHPDAAYRTAKCYEDGLGTRKDKAKAFQYYRKAATLNHPGAMYRLGLAEMKGELSLSRNVRDGHKWLKRSAEAATAQYPHAIHELALLHEKGLESVIFQDHKYALTLYHEAAVLGYAPSAYRLGCCYEFGKLGCTIDPVLSIHYYSLAAEQQHPEACFALTAWHLVGIPKVLLPSDGQAYFWALRAAQMELPKAEYAVGYFLEMGIGVPTKDVDAAMVWYQKAAEHGEKRALQRLQPFNDNKKKQQRKSTKYEKRKSYSGTSSSYVSASTDTSFPTMTASSAPNIVVNSVNSAQATMNKPTISKRRSFISISSRSNSQSSFIQKASSLFRSK
ncbi:hypothetical protein BDF20DRAFT_974050 [Mycotypha africana]|uniref:uncharacterized protein n=1 Tax=Mycotypha africana TaxID=64632 RepID=UPI00230181C6|nr:uncharacterized protein BDF20DRAFT_974050 [Mycotypha africana]KAI8979206.1 hypothetical protein BDF20DRAFT_974050 [Mycotypha africana]